MLAEHSLAVLQTDFPEEGLLLRAMSLSRNALLAIAKSSLSSQERFLLKKHRAATILAAARHRGSPFSHDFPLVFQESELAKPDGFVGLAN